MNSIGSCCYFYYRCRCLLIVVAFLCKFFPWTFQRTAGDCNWSGFVSVLLLFLHLNVFMFALALSLSRSFSLFVIVCRVPFGSLLFIDSILMWAISCYAHIDGLACAPMQYSLSHKNSDKKAKTKEMREKKQQSTRIVVWKCGLHNTNV